MIPTETLEIAKTVSHFGSFTTAAKHLGKAPSAISYTIRKLEEKLNVSLFIRDSKHVVLTPAGKHFIKESEKLLNNLEQLENSTRQIASGWEDRLYITLDNIVNQGRVYDLIKDLQHTHPKTELVIGSEVYNGSWDALYHGRCQIVIGAPVIIPTMVKNDDRFTWRSMGPISWDFTVSPDHPLAKETSPLSLETVSHYRSVCIKDTSYIFNKGYNLLLDNQKVLIVPSFRAAIECLLQGFGATILPSHFVQPYIQQGLLIKKEVPDLKSNDECLLAWNRENMGNSLKWILNWLGQQEWLNKIWLQHDPKKPVSYHVP
ncbi:putative HTH-type transcriptional regulator YahB [invertebrate metagenome]|uniref:Putative HTH-type transcriptional regulator YahB n=1 Tax=invertebrate metagenome TaxID=1711999 RepID=A0A2H9T889_9ZZZZ